jgi:outer membrane lipoprotein-sorting protein
MSIIRRDFLGCILALPAALALGGAGQMAPVRRISFPKAEREALDRISAYLNAQRSLKGEFLQLGPQGQVDRGTIYLKRPGRVRFEYRPPNPILIVADGRSVAVANSRLKTVDRYPLSATPLEVLLGDNVDLRHTNSVLAVEMAPGSVTVKARTSQNRHVSNISFVFSDPGIELRQWTVIDDQGLSTTVSLSHVEPGAAVAETPFVPPQKTDFAKPPEEFFICPAVALSPSSVTVFAKKTNIARLWRRVMSPRRATARAPCRCSFPH